MFRPLEAIFRLHKIELEERDIIHIVCATAYQWEISASLRIGLVYLNLIPICRGEDILSLMQAVRSLDTISV